MPPFQSEKMIIISLCSSNYRFLIFRFRLNGIEISENMSQRIWGKSVWALAAAKCRACSVAAHLYGVSERVELVEGALCRLCKIFGVHRPIALFLKFLFVNIRKAFLSQLKNIYYSSYWLSNATKFGKTVVLVTYTGKGLVRLVASRTHHKKCLKMQWN